MHSSPLRFSRIAAVCLLGVLQLLASGCAQTTASAPGAISFNAQSKVSIVTPQNATTAEQTAAQELGVYLSQITGGEFLIVAENETASAPAIYVGNTAFAKAAGVDGSTLKSEEWRTKTQDGNLMLVGGGTRGTPYATYHFLEDVCGVRWWNPWEEAVPQRGVLPIPALDKRGKPAFAYRDIYMQYRHDKGRFASHNRLNGGGDVPIATEYGGSRNYGPPDHVHTLYRILSPEKYFEDHPDWFLVPGGGVPTPRNSQLHMSNPQMRAEFLRLLKDIIRQSHADAKAKGVAAPDVFSVSQEDSRVGFMGPNDAKLVAENGGAESAILLDFVNFLADGIKDEFPGVYIDTLAYFSGEKAPTKIRPRDNVIIRLTDTTSNLILPITHPRNAHFRKNLEAWSKITKNLRVWDYAVTFTYPGLPMPTTHTYPTDVRFWKTHNVEGIFVEHEFPILADLRDFKIWMQCKLFENPDLDYDALAKEFTDGFYGAAGKDVRRYIYALQNEAEKVGKEKGFEDVNWTVPAKPYNYLSLDFLLRANAIFDDAERAVASVAGEPGVLQRRVRHARMPLDRYMAVMRRAILKQWQQSDQSSKPFPFDYDKIGARYLKTWNEQIDLRTLEANREAERKIAAEEVQKLIAIELPPIPARFANLPPQKVDVYGPGAMRNYHNAARIVEDADAELGKATRLQMENTPEGERAKYNLPMTWGVYDNTGEKVLVQNLIQRADIPGAGYHWYKLGETKLTGNDTMYFFWSWWIQLDVGDAFIEDKPQQVFEVWANMKFEGPMFPHAKDGDKDAISVERVVFVQK
jgi:hypothetical protein